MKHYLMRSSGLIVTMLLAPVLLVGQSATPSARVAGRVVSHAGVGVEDALVHVSAAPMPGIRAPFADTTRTRADGSFAFPQVPTGRLRLCVHPEGKDLVGTCEWLPPLVVEGKDGETIRPEPIVLPEGHRLKVRVADARGFLDAGERSQARRALVLGALAPHAPIVQFRPVRKTATDRDLELVIPFDQDIQLLLTASGYVVSAGAHGVANRAQSVKIPVRLDKGKPASDVVLTVTGVE